MINKRIKVALEMQNMQRLYDVGGLRDLLAKGDAIESTNIINELVAEKVIKAFDYQGKTLYLFTGKLPPSNDVEAVNG